MLISPHQIVQQGSPCCHNFLTVSPIYHSKVNPVGPLDGVKLGEAVLLYVFNIEFSASLFEELLNKFIYKNMEASKLITKKSWKYCETRNLI